MINPATGIDDGIPAKPAPPDVWMQSIRYHTYLGIPQDVDAIYLAHEHMVETIENLKFAKRIQPPRKAVREP